MAAALKVIADDLDDWAVEFQERGNEIVALAVRGVAERLRDATNV